MLTVSVKLIDRNGRKFGVLYEAGNVGQAKFKAQQDYPGYYIEDAKVMSAEALKAA